MTFYRSRFFYSNLGGTDSRRARVYNAFISFQRLYCAVCWQHWVSMYLPFKLKRKGLGIGLKLVGVGGGHFCTPTVRRLWGSRSLRSHGFSPYSSQLLLHARRWGADFSTYRCQPGFSGSVKPWTCYSGIGSWIHTTFYFSIMFDIGYTYVTVYVCTYMPICA